MFVVGCLLAALRLHTPGMRGLFIVWLLCVAALPLAAHGGQYRGPGSVIPPGNPTSSGVSQNKTNGSTVPGVSNPRVPVNPAGIGAGGNAAVGARRSAGSVPRGYAVGDDLGRWEFWWEFGKDPYLQLRDAIYKDRWVDPYLRLWNPRMAADVGMVSPPTADDVRSVAMQLAAMLKSSDDRDTSSACLLALAKIGAARSGMDLVEEFKRFLARGDQELRESAALALGVSGSLDLQTQQVLVDLIGDTTEGQHLSGDSAVNERTRSFAAYGAGLLIKQSRQAGASMRLTAALRHVLNDPFKHERNLMVASIEALALFPRAWRSRAAGALRDSIVADLGKYYDRDLGPGDQLIQAHVPTAIARLLDPGSMIAAKWRERFSDDLRAGLRSSVRGDGKVNHHIAQSCAMALGLMCSPWADDNSAGRQIGELLVDVHRDHRDQQTRSFAVLSLARIGGQKSLAYILSAVDDANKAIEQPWLAMALGVIAASQRVDGSQEGASAEDFRRINASLLDQFGKARNPGTIGAIAVALGLAGSLDARDVLRETLVAQSKRPDVVGYVALGLGLLQDRRAITDLRVLRQGSLRRPFVMMQCVRALGLLGDKDLVGELISELAAPSVTLIRLSALVSALAQIGDRSCLPALQDLMANQDVSPLTRAFAAVALGGICDKSPMSWNSVYATQVNYRAATETLTDGATGILDLL